MSAATLSRWVGSGSVGLIAGMVAAWFVIRVLIMPPGVCVAALAVITAFLTFMIITGRHVIVPPRLATQGGAR